MSTMRRLGQHFLKNRAVLQEIAGVVGVTPGDVVIEIGAGHGELTNELFALSCKLVAGSAREPVKIIAIEKDPALAAVLRKKFSPEKLVEILEGDALRVLPELTKSRTLKLKSCSIVGNIPYYLTGKLLRIVGELPEKPRRCVFMLQQEVAERIAAEPPRMNRLAASVQFWAGPAVVAAVPKENFHPQPNVGSAIIALETRDERQKAGSDDYYRTVRILFGQPRKTILNNLRAARDDRQKLEKDLRTLGIAPADRPQDLTIEQIIGISRMRSSWVRGCGPGWG